MTEEITEVTPLTPQEFNKLREQVKESIIVARVGLLLRHPFFGNMATRLHLEECDDWCPTAATNGRTFYYNVMFFSTLSYKEIEFVVAHEILHCVFDHLSRCEDRLRWLHNISADYVSNNILIRDQIGELPKKIQCYHDPKYLGMTSEEVYDELYDNYDKEALEQLGQLLDEHIDWEGDSQGDSDNKNGQPKFSKEELEKIKDEVKEAMIQASQTAGAGNMPGEIERMIKSLTEPKMSWRELLQQQIQSTIKNDYSFSRYNRKSQHTGAILPGMNYQETIDICISLDMSGSIGDEQARDFLSEVKGIMDSFPDYKIKIWCFDTNVYNEQDFDPHCGDTIDSYKIIGGGGTDFMTNWSYMKKHDITPKKFIMFTDGYPWDSWGDSNYCDTVFIIHSHPDKNLTAPFGATAHYDA